MTVISTTGEVGEAGAKFPCSMGGCRGQRISVKWADGKRSRPCTKGMLYREKKDAWYIMNSEGKPHESYNS